MDERWSAEQTAEWLRNPTGEPIGGNDGCRALPPAPSGQQCTECGHWFPIPVELHHDDEECYRNRNEGFPDHGVRPSPPPSGDDDTETLRAEIHAIIKRGDTRSPEEWINDAEAHGLRRSEWPGWATASIVATALSARLDTATADALNAAADAYPPLLRSRSREVKDWLRARAAKHTP